MYILSIDIPRDIFFYIISTLGVLIKYNHKGENASWKINYTKKD